MDDERTRLSFARRKPRSGWSRPNKQRVELDLVVPTDLAAAFDALPGARERWDTMTRSPRRAALEWIVHARRPETRARRVRETAEQAALGRAILQWQRPVAGTDGPTATGAEGGQPSGVSGSSTRASKGRGP